MPKTTKPTARNPLTGRPITVGGLTWKKLLRDGVIKTPGYGEPESKFVVEVDDETLPPPLPLERQTANHTTHFIEEEDEEYPSLGAGPEPEPVKKPRFRSKSVKPLDAQNLITDCAVRGIKNNFDAISDFKKERENSEFTDDDDEQLNMLIQQMIVDEMANYDPSDDEKYSLESN